MKNLKIYFPLVNGDEFPLDYATGKELIQNMVTDDWGAPPTAMILEARTRDGRRVTITIPYSEKDEVFVSVE